MAKPKLVPNPEEMIEAELHAIETIVRSLKPLNRLARNRVLKAVGVLYGIDLDLDVDDTDRQLDEDEGEEF